MDEKKRSDREERILAFLSDPGYRPMKFREICMLLSVPKEDREEFKGILDRMMADGQITLRDNGRYEKAGPNLVTGIFSGTSKGFGFVTCPDLEEDLYIAATDTKGAFHGDTVQVQVLEAAYRGHRASGRITAIISRNTREITGVVQKRHRFCTVVPDNTKYGSRIIIRKGKEHGSRDGDRVVVRILDYGSPRRKAEGEIREVIGSISDPSCDVMAVIKSYQIPTEFPEEVLRQAEGIPAKLSPKDLEGRTDLRDLLTITIDGEDAKDLDDAVSLCVRDGVYHLDVHIADVSHYVTEGSPLDREALNRGTSVYFINRVIPMLPPALSNGICSLNAGTDRLALSCRMEIDGRGNIIGHEIVETVIRVDHRTSYRQVSSLLEGRQEEAAQAGRADSRMNSRSGDVSAELMEMLQAMRELSDLLRQKRMDRGGIDFDFEESVVTVDGNGVPVQIGAYDRDIASRMIEDFMLAANETIAEDFFWQELPFLYRSHEAPDPDKIRRLHYFIKNYGYYINTRNESVHPKEFQKLLAKISGSGEESMISRLVLRSMKRARYTRECFGHFGLAVSYYCHFTSPIRRYPDLQIHRIIKENLHGGIRGERLEHYEKILPGVATESSRTERRADEAEREIIKLKKAEYMQQRIGDRYTGVISSLTGGGIYVELESTCEGLIRYESMDDYYDLDESGCFVTGSRTGKEYRLGDRVPICVKSVDLLSKTVYFEMAEERNGRRRE